MYVFVLLIFATVLSLQCFADDRIVHRNNLSTGITDDSSKCASALKPWRTTLTNGILTVWNAKGKKKEQGAYSRGLRTGKWKFWSRHNQVFFEGELLRPCRCGTSCLYRSSGSESNRNSRLLYEQWYEGGKLVAEGALLEKLVDKKVYARGFLSTDGKEKWSLKQHGYWRIYNKSGNGKLVKEQWYIFGKLKQTIVQP